MNTIVSETPERRGAKRARITVNIELAQLGLDTHVLTLALEELVLDGSDQARACEVELEGEIGGVHLDSLAVRFVVDVFLPATESGGLASRSEEVEILRSRGGEIYESTKRKLMMERCGCKNNCSHLEFCFP